MQTSTHQGARSKHEGHTANLRAELLRGGRFVKVKGILMSAAPSLLGVSLVAGLTLAQPAFAVDFTITNPPSNAPVIVESPGVDNVTITANGPITNGADAAHAPIDIDVDANADDITVNVQSVTTTAGINAGIFISTAGTGDVSVTTGGDVTGTARGINIIHSGSGNVSLTSTADVTGDTAGVRIVGSSQPGFDVTVNVNTVTANGNAAIDVNNLSQGGATSITATGTLTNTAGHGVRTNGVDGVQAGTMRGPLTIDVQDIVTGSRAAPNDLFTSGGSDGIQIVGPVGNAATPQPVSISTGDLDVTGNGVNMAFAINRVDGETSVTTGNITAGGQGVTIESNDSANNYAITVVTGDLTTGSSGVGVNQSGTGSISVETGDINAGTLTAGGINGFQDEGGFGVRLDSDPNGATMAGTGGADWNLTTGDITVTNRATGNAAGTGIGLGTIQNGGNGNTTVSAGNITAGTGVIYNRNGSGAVSLTTGNINAETGNGIQFGTNIVRNDLVITTGDITAAGAGITGDTLNGPGATTIDVGNITTAGDGIDIIHSGAGAATITTGDVTSSGGRGVALNNDAGAFNADETVGGVSVTTGAVEASSNAIDVVSRVKQTPTVITANGAVTSLNGQGIVLTQINTGTGAADVTVTANDAVTAASTAINISTSGPGDTSVLASGPVTGTAGFGVRVATAGVGDATIETQDTVTARVGISLGMSADGDATIRAAELVNATAGDGIQLTSFRNGDVSIAADQGVIATGNGIDLGGSANSNANMGSVSITAGGLIDAAGTGINGDTGTNSSTTTITVEDIESGGDGINWIHTGRGVARITSTGTIDSNAIGIDLTTDSATFNNSPDSQTIITVNNITTPNNTAINLNSNAANGTVITTNGAINTLSASLIGGDGMRIIEQQGPLQVNVAATSTITSFNNTMELTNNGTEGTTVNVDGTLISTTLNGGGDGVIWVWGTPGTTTVKINDGATVQAADSSGFAMTDNGGASIVNVGIATITGGFRQGAGNDALTFNGTDMSNVGTLNGGAGSTGGGDVLTLNSIQNFVRDLQVVGQEIQNWDAVNLNGGTADLVGTMTTGAFTLGQDAAGTPAALTIGANTVGDTLTITGNYIGAGGGIVIDTDASTHTADQLVVGGDVSGITGLSLNNLTPQGALSDLVDIAVVDVTGASPGNAFVLSNGPALLGGRAYQLQQGDSMGGNPLDWFLAVQPCPPGGINDTNGTTLGCQTDDMLTVNGMESVDGNLEGAGGMDQLTVAGDASVTGIVAGGQVGADSSAPVDGGDQIVINTTGSVGGVQGNLGDDLIIVTGNSTVTGNVVGNEGSNQIRIGGLGALPDGSLPTDDAPTVNGDVLGGDSAATDGNNQIWVLGGARVLGKVVGGNGNDMVVLNGATAAVSGAIEGGEGNDVIALMRGSAASVSGANGNDNISLDGASIADAIDAGEGDNLLSLNAGTASSVLAGAGVDTITLAGAAISGAINSGAGNNVIRLNSGSAGSVTAGAGLDTITLAGATINGAIEAGDGNNAIALTAGRAASVAAGAGNDSITLAGAAITGAINAGDGANLIALTSGSAASVTAGTGNDSVTLAGATIGGAVNVGDGANLVALTSGSAASVTAGTGNDSITLAGAAISGAINSGAGNNTLALNSGTADSVAAGAGLDTITLAGARIAAALDAGNGNNLITLSAGSAGSVLAGSGADTITLSGAAIGGAINGGDGDNVLALSGGSAGSVTTGVGNDAVTLSGAMITGALTTGAGNDTVNLTSGAVTGGLNTGAGTDVVNVAGATFTLGNTRLDGGAAGEGNVLNLNSVNQTLTTPQSNLVNWDTVNIDASTVTVSGGDSLTSAQVNLINSTLVARDGFTINGNLSIDPSTVDLQDGAVGDVLTVTGNYDSIGPDNALNIDADFAADLADELQVGGAITGITELNVSDVTPSAGAATGQDVLVAQAGTGADVANFILVGGPIAKGIWDYDLANGVVANSVVLRGSLNSLAALYSASAGALADGLGELPTLEERVGQRQWLTRDTESAFQGLWIRLAGDRTTKTPAASALEYTTRNNYWGVQLGADFTVLASEDGVLTAGITGQYKSMDAEVQRPSSADRGNINADGGGGGVNLTLNGAKGGYVDLQAQYNAAKATLGTSSLGDTVSGLKVDTTSASLEAGKRFAITDNRKNVLVPQAQVSWTQLSVDGFTDSSGVAVDLDPYSTSVARVGLAYEFHPNGLNVAGPDTDGKMFYAIANVLRNLSPRHTAVAQNQSLVTRDEKTWGEVGLGGSYLLGSHTLVYGQATYTQSLGSDAADNHGVGGTVGVRWSFGTPKPAAEAVSASALSTTVDSDGDGVVDADDRCQGTPKGIAVDAIGCQVIVQAVTVQPVPAAPQRFELKGVAFEVNSNQLTDESRRILDEAAASLVPVLKASPVVMVEVGGHTDTSGNAQKNLELSQARADAVREYLVTRGFNAAEIKAVGYGSSQPLDTNETPEGRVNNRRVELKLIRK